MKVCIDAGHGGSDPGAVNEKLSLQEKDIVLDISMILADMLDYTVVMTRETDRYLSLTDRCMTANTAGADIFVSVHTNAFHAAEAEGIEVLHWPGSERGIKLAELLQVRLVYELEWRNRGIKDRDDLAVLRDTNMPAALAEIGFISNPKEGKAMQACNFRRMAAKALKLGINDYIKEKK